MRDKRRFLTFDVALISLYALLIGILTLRHELWPDEVQQWLIARDSHGMEQLFHNRRYEGHPMLWYMILYPFAHLSANVQAIKPINWVLSIVAGYLSIHYFLKGYLEKILFLLAPLPIFYFAVVTRPYMLGYLLVVLVCLAFRQPRRMLTIFLLLGLLANIHTYFLLMAACFLLYYLLALGLPQTIRQMPSRFWVGLMLCLCLFAACIWQVIPPADDSYQAGYRPASLANVFAMYTLAMAPFLGGNPAFIVFLLLLAPFIYLAILSVRNTPRIAVFLLSSTFGLLLFQALFYGGAPWHAGVIYVCILASIFLMRDTSALSPDDSRKFDYTVLAMLAIHAISGLVLLWTVATTPCSLAKYAAAFIRSYCTAGCTVIGDESFHGIGVSGYLGAQPIYYVDRQAFGTFAIPDSQHFMPHGMEQVVEAAQRFKNPIMLVNQLATPEEIHRFHLHLLQGISGSMVPNEQYYIYVFDHS